MLYIKPLFSRSAWTGFKLHLDVSTEGLNDFWPINSMHKILIRSITVAKKQKQKKKKKNVQTEKQKVDCPLRMHRNQMHMIQFLES